jgi:anti-sigma B factor antagonist
MTGNELAIQRDRRDRTVVVTVSGELDVVSGAGLRTALGEELNDPGVEQVIADLTAVTFLSSTGIAALVDAEGEARHHGKTMKVVTGGVRAVERPIQLTRVDEMLALYPDLDSALTFS